MHKSLFVFLKKSDLLFLEPKSGYQKASKKKEGCVDINECGEMNSFDFDNMIWGFDGKICHKHAECYNSPGAFRSRYSK